MTEPAKNPRSKMSGSPRALLIFSMTVFGTVGLFVRFIPLSSAEIALFRAALAGAMLFVYLKYLRKGNGQSVPRGVLPWTLFSGVVMAVNWIVLFEALRYTTVSAATLAYYVAPVLVTLGSAVLFKERVTRWQLACFFMTLVGLVLLINPAGGTGEKHLLGIGLALLAAVLYATVILMNMRLKSVDAVYRTFLQFVAAVTVLTPYVALGSGFQLGAMGAGGWAALVVLGLFHTGLTYCLYFSAVQKLPGREIAIFSYIDPLVAVLASALFLRETFTLVQALGGALILAFTYLSGRKRGTAT